MRSYIAIQSKALSVWLLTKARVSDRGAGLIEYTMLMALIVLVCMSAITYFGGETSSKLVIEGSCFEGGCGPP